MNVLQLMHFNNENQKKLISRMISYAEDIFLPLILAGLFVIQNLEFNKWLKIYSDGYFSRLVLATFALGIILFGFSLLFKKRYKYIYLFFISFLVSVVFSVQFLYYKYSQSFLQFSAIKYIGQAGSVAQTARTLVTPELILFFSGLVVVLIAFFLSKRKSYTEFILPKWEKVIFIIAMALVAFYGYKYLLDTEKKEWGSTSRLYTDVYDLKTIVGKMGIVNFFLEDTFKYAISQNLTSDSDKDFLVSFAKQRATVLTTKPTTKEKTKTPAYYGSEKGKNLIIIQVESLENAVINKTINGQEITPNLNQLAKEGLYFNNYYTQVGPGNTADAEFSTMDSLYPLPDDVVFIDYAKNSYKALPQLLVKNGYQTYSMHGDVPTFWNRSNMYPSLGYQKAYSLSDYTVTRPVGEGPSDLGDEDLFSQSLPKLESFKQPFMATLITMSLHTPFILPEDLQTLNIPDQTNLTQTQWEYMQAAHYTDKAIGEFIDGLKRDGLYNNSLILIWGDHGSFQNISEALSPINLNADPATEQSYENLDVENVGNDGQNTNLPPDLLNSQVPLILLAPGTDLQGTTGTPGSHLDIYPTVTNLLGISTPKTILGQDLLNTKTPVETHFELVSGGIDTILTKDLLYESSNDGEFKDGSCQSWPNQIGIPISLPISNCQDLYNQQAANIKASNIIVRGNLLNDLTK